MIIGTNAENGCYNILVKRGAIDDDGAFSAFAKNEKTLIVTDDGVPEDYIRRISAHFKDPVLIALPQGEKSKNTENYLFLLRTMLHGGFTRHDGVVAAGGGMVGDLAGFAAATYMRGIAFYNVPTTFLAQADASVGGKTAIDLDGVKNAAGAFYPPRGVIIDPNVLSTLSPRQLHAGIAEAIKTAVIGDKELFALLEDEASFEKNAEEIIIRSLRFKISVTERDPKEKGLRKVLNFGHTIGHAIESEKHGELLHGECVSLGMLPFASPKIVSRLKNLLQKYDLPLRASFSPQKIADFIRKDKKAEGNNDLIDVVYADDIGKYSFRTKSVPEILELCEVIL